MGIFVVKCPHCNKVYLKLFGHDCGVYFDNNEYNLHKRYLDQSKPQPAESDEKLKNKFGRN